jgi:hypothetical protein
MSGGVQEQIPLSRVNGATQVVHVLFALQVVQLLILHKI